VHHDAGVGQRVAHADGPAASSSEPMDAAWPMHKVAIGERMNCMVS
jgi:hypothetical protein